MAEWLPGGLGLLALAILTPLVYYLIYIFLFAPLNRSALEDLAETRRLWELILRALREAPPSQKGDT